MRVYRLCTLCVLAVVTSDYTAPMADDKVNNDLNENLSVLFNDAVNCWDYTVSDDRMTMQHS